MLGAELALKPQLGVGVAAAMVRNPRTRRDGLRAVGVGLAVLLAGCLAYRWRLGSFRFLGDLVGNLKASLLPGSTSDASAVNIESYDFLNLQAMYSRVGHGSMGTVEVLTWLTTGALGTGAWWAERRTDGLRRRPWTMVALMCVIGLLPVYHRGMTGWLRCC